MDDDGEEKADVTNPNRFDFPTPLRFLRRLAMPNEIFRKTEWQPYQDAEASGPVLTYLLLAALILASGISTAIVCFFAYKSTVWHGAEDFSRLGLLAIGVPLIPFQFLFSWVAKRMLVRRLPLSIHHSHIALCSWRIVFWGLPLLSIAMIVFGL